jgi:hypothetical protein
MAHMPEAQRGRNIEDARAFMRFSQPAMCGVETQDLQIRDRAHAEDVFK